MMGNEDRPSAMNDARSVLKAGTRLSSLVKIRQRQFQLLSERCLELIRHSENHPQSTDLPVGTIVEDVKVVGQNLKSAMENVVAKGFLWCLVNGDTVDRQIRSLDSSIERVHQTLCRSVHQDRALQMTRAREEDQAELQGTLDTVSKSEIQLIQAIQDYGGVYRTVQEVTVAVVKYIQSVPSPYTQTAETAFLQKAGRALCRVYNISANKAVASHVLSSLEIEFNVNSSIGHGASGEVFKGYWNGATVAVKRLHVEDARIISPEQNKAIRHEVKIWSTLNHPNVLTFYGACLEASVPFLVMRYCPFGNVGSYLSRYSDANRENLAHEVALGLAFLHEKSIVHADIKSANVLISEDHHALLADFGLALQLYHVRTQSSFSADMNRRRGTLLWMAPEVLEGASPDMAADVYSLGLTIWELFSGEVPYHNYISPELLIDGVVSRQKRPTRPSRMSQDHVWAIVENCWKADANARPTSREVQTTLRQPTEQFYDHSKPAEPLDIFDNSCDGADAELPNSIPDISDRLPDTTWSASVPSWLTPAHTTTAANDPTTHLPPVLPIPLISSIARPIVASHDTDPAAALCLRIVETLPPQWTHVPKDDGGPRTLVTAVTFLHVITKVYHYRVVKGSDDLGIQKTRPQNADESQTVNFLDYNAGRGIRDTDHIKVYMVDPATSVNTLLAEWNPDSKPLGHIDNEWSLSIRGGKVTWIPDDTRQFTVGVRFERPATNKFTKFRIIGGENDLGTRIPRGLEPDGSLKVDFPNGRAVPYQTPIKIFVVRGRMETLVAGLCP